MKTFLYLKFLEFKYVLTTPKYIVPLIVIILITIFGCDWLCNNYPNILHIIGIISIILAVLSWTMLIIGNIIKTLMIKNGESNIQTEMEKFEKGIYK